MSNTLQDKPRQFVRPPRKVAKETSTDMSQQKPSKAARHSQGGLMLWHGMTISGIFKLFCSGPALHWSRLHRTISLPFTAVYNSLFKLAENIVYGRKIAATEVKESPLFVLGYWRSGTTLLQTLLSNDPNLQHLPLYRTLFPWHFLLTEKVMTKLTAPFVPTARPMDNMKVSWDAPQEDDVSLCIMSQISPYMLLAHSDNFQEFWKPLDFEKLPEKDIALWKSCLDLLVRKLTFHSPKRILMKSPFHTFHIKTLLEMYPDARFLYIHRNPYHIFRSAVHLRKRMIEENTLGKTPSSGHEEEVIRSYQFGFEKYQEQKDLIPEGNLVEIAYSNLEADPIGTLKMAYDGLNLPGFDAVKEAIEPQLESLRSYRKNQFDDDPDMVRKVYKELKPAFEKYGYKSPLAE